MSFNIYIYWHLTQTPSLLILLNIVVSFNDTRGKSYGKENFPCFLLIDLHIYIWVGKAYRNRNCPKLKIKLQHKKMKLHDMVRPLFDTCRYPTGRSSHTVVIWSSIHVLLFCIKIHHINCKSRDDLLEHMDIHPWSRSPRPCSIDYSIFSHHCLSY